MNTPAVPASSGPTRVGPRIRVCRGCCCGTTRKHPDVDHDGIADILTHHCGPDTELVRTACLWACELSNVVVVNPSAEARHAGARPAWITHVNTAERAEALAVWVRDGGPGLAEPPPQLGRIRTGAEIARTGTTDG